MKKVVIIGAGLGGLSCAIYLRLNGYAVTMVEKEQELGGKLKSVIFDDFRFDLGPSTITMTSAFLDVFYTANVKPEDYVTFYPINPHTRNFFPDGHSVDLSTDIEKIEEEISKYSPKDANNFQAFYEESKRLYQIADRQFLNRLLINKQDMLEPSLINAFRKIKPFTSMQKLLRRYFEHPNTLAMLGRYATYVGASPYKAPAIFHMMLYLEVGLGVYGVKGGTYSIVKAFEKLALKLGVLIYKNTEVNEIHIHGKKVRGVETSIGYFEADEIVANADALTVYSTLIAEKHRPSFSSMKIARMEPSLSGFVGLVGIDKQFPQLLHHNVYFPADYEAEFVDIFQKKTPVMDPTIYLCYSGYSDKEQCPPNKSNLFILANAPSLTVNSDWDAWKEDYGTKILTKLDRIGLAGISKEPVFKKWYTAEDIHRDSGAYKGAIYGLSSNGAKQSFFKIKNKAIDIEGLWFVGGSTHPGGGTPIVTKSGKLVAEYITQNK